MGLPNLVTLKGPCASPGENLSARPNFVIQQESNFSQRMGAFESNHLSGALCLPETCF
jgi:hypothetical protein